MQTEKEIKKFLENIQKHFEEFSLTMTEESRMYSTGWINALIWVLTNKDKNNEW